MPHLVARDARWAVEWRGGGLSALVCLELREGDLKHLEEVSLIHLTIEYRPVANQTCRLLPQLKREAFGGLNVSFCDYLLA